MVGGVDGLKTLTVTLMACLLLHNNKFICIKGFITTKRLKSVLNVFYAQLNNTILLLFRQYSVVVKLDAFQT